jgi:hypothetical protein
MLASILSNQRGCVICAVVSVFLWWEIVFGVTYVFRAQYKMARSNRYLGGTDDGQMTPCGYPNFNFYVKNLHVP